MAVQPSAALVVALLLLTCLFHRSLGFVLPGSNAFSRKCFKIRATGMGMGMASSSKKKKGGGGASKNKKKKGKSSFDVSKSMLKSEKLYDELLKEATKGLDEDHPNFGVTMTTEYIIAARLNPQATGFPGASDWVPVAQLCLTRPIEHGDSDQSSLEKERLSRAISFYCREINYVATLGSSLFKSIPRNLLQYSAEDIDSFYKFVYEDVIEGKNNDDKNDDVMTKAEARAVLQLSEDCNDLAEVKKAYRKLSMQYHPDRFVGVERTQEEEEKTNDAFSKVKIAYETLNSGIRTNAGGKVKSWYESLGGRARTDFIGPIDLVSMDSAKLELSKRDVKCALAGLTPETVMAFVTRNQVAA